MMNLLWVKTNGIPFWGRCTTQFGAYFSGWIGMLTGGTIWILTHGQLPPFNCCPLGGMPALGQHLQAIQDEGLLGELVANFSLWAISFRDQDPFFATFSWRVGCLTHHKQTWTQALVLGGGLCPRSLSHGQTSLLGLSLDLAKQTFLKHISSNSGGEGEQQTVKIGFREQICRICKWILQFWRHPPKHVLVDRAA